MFVSFVKASFLLVYLNGWYSCKYIGFFKINLSQTLIHDQPKLIIIKNYSQNNTVIFTTKN